MTQDLATLLATADALCAEGRAEGGRFCDSDDIAMLGALVAALRASRGESEALRDDAARWRALFVDGGRVRCTGSARIGDDTGTYRHIGIELWNEYPHFHRDSRDRELLAQFADEVIAAQALKATADASRGGGA